MQEVVPETRDTVCQRMRETFADPAQWPQPMLVGHEEENWNRIATPCWHLPPKRPGT